MKKMAIIALLLAGCFLMPDSYSLAKSVKSGEPVHAFYGKVVQVDVASSSFSVKEKESIVGFDASSPVFSGYSSLSAMRVGDRVAVSYTASGIRITKLSGTISPEAVERVHAARQPGLGAAQGKGGRVLGRLIRREKKREDPTGFSDADINQDGRITPIGLSVVIKDVTLDEFRQFDKRHKGYLDRAEFLEAVKHLRAGDR